MYLIGEFADAPSTAVAIEALKARGVETEDLALFSSEPVELQPGVLDRPSRMSLLAVIGAVTVCLLAVGFVYYTQRDYPLITGGMPVFSLWATGVIFYEMTMLGAIAATFVVFLRESGLLRRNPTGPVPAVEPGRILLRIRCETDKIAQVGECLYRSGANRVEKLA